MPNRPDSSKQRESTLLLTLLTLFLFASPLTHWWAGENNPWFLPYLLWLAIILITAWLTRKHRHDV